MRANVCGCHRTATSVEMTAATYCATYVTVYLLTSETGSHSWWRPQMGGRNVDNVH